MNRAQALSVSALLGAALAASAGQPRSLYSAPKASAAAAEAPAGEPQAPTPAMEEKFRKLQKEMRSAPEAGPAAASAEDSHAQAPGDEASVGGLALRILCGLAFVLVLAVVAIRFLKRMQGGLLARPAGPRGDLLEVLETCHLGPQQKVVAIRMHDEVGVLGVNKESIRLLTVLKQPAQDIRRARQGESNSAAFSDNLNKLLDRFKKPKKVSDLLDESQA
jgi:flagellar biogenesis protein FliO